MQALDKHAARRRKDVSTLSTKEIREWLQYQPGMGSTAARRWSALRSYFRFLVLHGHRETNPMDTIERQTVPRGVPPIVFYLEDKIAEADEPYKSIAQLVYYTAVTAQELRTIPLREYAGANQVRVPGRGKRERSIQLDGPARAALRRIRHHLPEGEWPSARAIQRYLPTGAALSDIRNTVAAELANDGTDSTIIKETMGYASIASTSPFMTAFGSQPGPEEIRRAMRRRLRHPLSPEDIKGKR